MLWRWGACPLVLLLAWPVSAQRLGALRASSGSSAIEVVSEAIDVRCAAGEAEQALECAIEVTWELRNPSDTAVSAALMMTLDGAGESTISLDGAALGEAPTLRPLSVGVPPGHTTRVVLRTTLMLGTPGTASDPAASLLEARDALSARHPVLVAPWNGTRRGFRWTRPIAIRWASVGPTSITVHAPTGWRVGGEGFSEREVEGAREGSYTSGEQPPPAIDVSLEHGGSRDDVRAGGPFIGLGGTFDQGFRLRAGWEMGFTEWVLVSASVDTDFQRFVVITPLVEVASWSLIVAPSLAAGIGVPIRYGPIGQPGMTRDAWTAGIRLETSATFLSVAFVASFDIYPELGSAEITLMGRVGL